MNAFFAFFTIYRKTWNAAIASCAIAAGIGVQVPPAVAADDLKNDTLHWDGANLNQFFSEDVGLGRPVWYMGWTPPTSDTTGSKITRPPEPFKNLIPVLKGVVEDKDYMQFGIPSYDAAVSLFSSGVWKSGDATKTGSGSPWYNNRGPANAPINEVSSMAASWERKYIKINLGITKIRVDTGVKYDKWYWRKVGYMIGTIKMPTEFSGFNRSAILAKLPSALHGEMLIGVPGADGGRWYQVMKGTGPKYGKGDEFTDDAGNLFSPYFVRNQERGYNGRHYVVHINPAPIDPSSLIQPDKLLWLDENTDFARPAIATAFEWTERLREEKIALGIPESALDLVVSTASKTLWDGRTPDRYEEQFNSLRQAELSAGYLEGGRIAAPPLLSTSTFEPNLLGTTTPPSNAVLNPSTGEYRIPWTQDRPAPAPDTQEELDMQRGYSIWTPSSAGFQNPDNNISFSARITTTGDGRTGDNQAWVNMTLSEMTYPMTVKQINAGLAADALANGDTTTDTRLQDGNGNLIPETEVQLMPVDTAADSRRPDGTEVVMCFYEGRPVMPKFSLRTRHMPNGDEEYKKWLLEVNRNGNAIGTLKTMIDKITAKIATTNSVITTNSNALNNARSVLATRQNEYDAVVTGLEFAKKQLEQAQENGTAPDAGGTQRTEAWWTTTVANMQRNADARGIVLLKQKDEVGYYEHVAKVLQSGGAEAYTKSHYDIGGKIDKNPGRYWNTPADRVELARLDESKNGVGGKYVALEAANKVKAEIDAYYDDIRTKVRNTNTAYDAHDKVRKDLLANNAAIRTAFAALFPEINERLKGRYFRKGWNIVPVNITVPKFSVPSIPSVSHTCYDSNGVHTYTVVPEEGMTITMGVLGAADSKVATPGYSAVIIPAHTHWVSLFRRIKVSIPEETKVVTFSSGSAGTYLTGTWPFLVYSTADVYYEPRKYTKGEPRPAELGMQLTEGTVFMFYAANGYYKFDKDSIIVAGPESHKSDNTH